jgi:tRNA modification GTPase
VHQDTIFALASGRPPAAIAIIRITGPTAHLAATTLAGDLPATRRAALRTLRHNGDVLDEALVLRFDRPQSATGEDVVEFHCHGGRAVVDAVLKALSSLAGVRAAVPGEFTRRAFSNGRIDLTEAEGLADLLEAETESQRRAALALSGGGLRRQVEVWQSQILGLSAQAEAAIDYDDQDVGKVEQEFSEAIHELARDLESWLLKPRIEPLKDGIRVVLAGPPNAGKSSLLNAIAGSEKAIVTETAGTTRDTIEVPLSVAGQPMIFIDTAGMRESTDVVENIGIARAQASVTSADVLLWLGEDPPPEHRKAIWLQPRCDLAGRSTVTAGRLPVSAKTGYGITDLIERISCEVRQMLPADGAVVINQRQALAIGEAASALTSLKTPADLILIAEVLRSARLAFDKLTGRAGFDDVLDHLFGRFCLGK